MAVTLFVATLAALQTCGDVRQLYATNECCGASADQTVNATASCGDCRGHSQERVMYTSVLGFSANLTFDGLREVAHDCGTRTEHVHTLTLNRSDVAPFSVSRLVHDAEMTGQLIRTDPFLAYVTNATARPKLSVHVMATNWAVNVSTAFAAFVLNATLTDDLVRFTLMSNPADQYVPFAIDQDNFTSCDRHYHYRDSASLSLHTLSDTLDQFAIDFYLLPFQLINAALVLTILTELEQKFPRLQTIEQCLIQCRASCPINTCVPHGWNVAHRIFINNVPGDILEHVWLAWASPISQRIRPEYF